MARLRTAALVIFGILLVWTLSGMLFMPFGSLLEYADGVLDNTFLMTDARMFINHTDLFFSDQLGFPVGADHNYFPRPTWFPLLITWVGALLTHNVLAVAQFYFLATSALIFAACFFALRWLGADTLVAFILSLAYCFLPFTRDRISHHEYYAYYAAPLAGALAIHLGRVQYAGSLKQIIKENVWTPFVIVACIFAAWTNFYYAFFSMFFLAVAGVTLTLASRKWGPLALAGAYIGIILVLTLIGMMHYIVRPETFPSRGVSDQVMSGIRIPDILRIYHTQKIQQLYTDYYQKIRGPGEGKDFWPGRILSLIILCAPAMVFIAAQQRGKSWLQNPAAQTITLVTSLILAGLLFGLPFSYGTLFNMLVWSTIRSQNRFTVFLTFFALVIIASFWPYLRERCKKYAYIPPVVLALLMLYNAFPALGYTQENYREYVEQADGEAKKKEIVATLDLLHKANAHNVLQLPVAGWPEVPHVRNFDPYNHLWFYILDSEKPPLRWSYGMDWHQPEFPEISGLGGALETPVGKDAWQRFRCLGFDAVIIEKSAYEPAIFAQMTKTLKDDFGIGRPLANSERRAVYMMTPIPNTPAACPPLAGLDAFKVEMPCPASVDLTKQDHAIDEMLGSFYQAEPMGRWSRDKKTSFYCKFTAEPFPAKVKIDLQAFVPHDHPQHVTITVNGGPPHSYVFDKDMTPRTVTLDVAPAPGNHINIQFELPDAVKPKDVGGAHDDRKIAVNVRAITFAQ